MSCIIKAYSLNELGKSKKVFVAFKGAFYCKTQDKKGFFLFPWNVTQLELPEISFPVSLYSFSGKKTLTLSDVDFLVPTWKPEIGWDERGAHPLQTISVSSLQQTVKLDYSLPKPALDKLCHADIRIKQEDLSHLQDFQLPDSISKISK